MSFYPTFTDIYSKAIKNIEYHYGRESPQYLRYLEAINKHREYINKSIINDLLDSLGVVSVRGYYYRIFNKVEQIDINNESFEYWVQNRVLLLFPFQMLYKNIGQFCIEESKALAFNLNYFNPLDVFGEYDWWYQISISKFSLLSFLDNPLNIYRDSIFLNEEFVFDTNYLLIKLLKFPAGDIIFLPSDYVYTISDVDLGDNISVKKHTYSNQKGLYYLFFKINPNFDYDEYLSKLYKWKYVLTPNPVIKKCCLFDIFSKKTNQN